MAGRFSRTSDQRPRSARIVGAARTRVAPATRSSTIAPELQPSTSSDFANGPLLPNVAADASASQRPKPVDRVLMNPHPFVGLDVAVTHHVMGKAPYTRDSSDRERLESRCFLPMTRRWRSGPQPDRK